MDVRIANLIGLNTLSIGLFFCVYFSKHRHHKVYGYLAVFMFTAFNLAFFGSLGPNPSPSYSWTGGVMYVYLAVIYAVICLAIYIYRTIYPFELKNRSSLMESRFMSMSTDEFTDDAGDPPLSLVGTRHFIAGKAIYFCYNSNSDLELIMQYKDGLAHGFYCYILESTVVQFATFQSGRLHGESSHINSHGILKSIHFVDGQEQIDFE